MSESLLNPEDERLCGLLTELVKALVDAEKDVRVEVLSAPETITLRLHVAESDVGKLIGRQGHTARSLRTILSAIGMKYKRRYALDIVGAHPSGHSR
ncbi:KH domain-containing protein [Terriglobus sp. ADX1]|uniref:KH domain-containing protein n=1 Tax=Terriglobus sp. ADX1 TaxID=2794063 RepID=UPI002FE60E3B